MFVSGDQHWGELMAKRMPPTAEGDAAAVLCECRRIPSYAPCPCAEPSPLRDACFRIRVCADEVTASGIDQNWDETIENSHRLRVRTCL